MNERCHHCDGSGKRTIDYFGDGKRTDLMCKHCGGVGVLPDADVVRRSLEDVKAGRTQPLDNFIRELEASQ